MSHRLIADIGGTNARFAVAQGGGTGEIVRLAAADYPRFEDVLEAALARLPGAEEIGEVAIAAAGPVSDGEIDVTNLPWRIEAAAVSARLGGAEVRLVNDLEAVALALPHLPETSLDPLRSAGDRAGNRPMIAINVGSGFGAATAAPVRGAWTALAGEPGHMPFAAANEPEWQQRGAAVACVEDLLSGRGLVALYGRLGGSEATDSAGVFARGDSDPAASDAVALFATVLGRIAGDLVLATGAWSGAFLCGGLICEPRGEAFDRAFLEAFDAKGAMSARIGRVPVFRIIGTNPALRGLAAMSF